MKLNLLPTHVSKGSQTRVAVLLAVVIAAVAIGLTGFMITTSNAKLAAEKARVDAALPVANEAVKISAEADTIMQRSAGLILNINLADAMNAHSAKYPAVYDTVKLFVPSFFRVTEMNADPAGTNTKVTITGVIQSYQQYADLMLALLRVPNAYAVTRTGYQLNAAQLPPISDTNQNPVPLKPGEEPLPQDPMARLEARINRARGQSGMQYDGAGNFGSLDESQRERGAMPNWSEITVELYIQTDLNTPDPRGTLSQSGALWGTGGGGGGGGNNPAPNTNRPTPAPAPNPNDR